MMKLSKGFCDYNDYSDLERSQVLSHDYCRAKFVNRSHDA